MDISGEYTFDAEQKLVWDALLDPNVLGSIMPGGKGFEQVADNQYSGVLEVKVGPVQGTFQGQIKLSDVQAPGSYQMEVEGKGAPGVVKATGQIHLEARNHQTFMQYKGTAQIGGRIASVGQRLLDSAARSIIRQSLDALNEYLKVEAARQAPQPAAASPNSTTPEGAASPSGAVPGYKPPSQMGLALNVARDVIGDIIPAKYQPWVFGAVVAIILLIIWLIVSRP
jgi:carbon monoxide dehydrogenase subunit G